MNVLESVDFAFSQLKVDKFRTFLSLLGVCIGIFSIVAVVTVVSFMQNGIIEGFSSFGNDMVFVSKMSMAPDEEGSVTQWWKYKNRPNVKYSEYEFIAKNATTIEKIAYRADFQKAVKYMSNTFNNSSCLGASPGWEMFFQGEMRSGRLLSESEIRHATKVAVIGSDIAEKLFPNDIDPIGKVIKISGSNLTVVGVFEKMGSGQMVNMINVDIAVVMPFGCVQEIVDIDTFSGPIAIVPRKDVTLDEFRGEIRTLMRQVRRLRPVQRDNFAISSMSFLLDEITEVFSLVNLIGWIIGGFSLLIGGFGIANIMFVSVKERTNQIGIQKALGAKRRVILTQFLIESATLSLAGGFVGIMLVYIITLFLRNSVFAVTLTLNSVFIGMGISLVIGVVAGVVPALAAARLNPVEAINS